MKKPLFNCTFKKNEKNQIKPEFWSLEYNVCKDIYRNKTEESTLGTCRQTQRHYHILPEEGDKDEKIKI